MLRKLIGQLREQARAFDGKRLAAVKAEVDQVRSAIESGTIKGVAAQKKAEERLWKSVLGLAKEILTINQEDNSTLTTGARFRTWSNKDAQALDHFASWSLFRPSRNKEKNVTDFISLVQKVFGSKFDEATDLMIQVSDLRSEVLSVGGGAKELRARAEMTCQICGGKYLAPRGKMAHHGYRRPGSGQIEETCFGSTYPPFEVSSDRLGEWIEMLKRYLNTAKIDLADKSKRNAVLQLSGYTLNGVLPSMFAYVTPDNFDQEFNRLTAEGARNLNATSYKQLQQKQIRDLKDDIKALDRDIERQTKRYDDWEG